MTKREIVDQLIEKQIENGHQKPCDDDWDYGVRVAILGKLPVARLRRRLEMELAGRDSRAEINEIR